MILRRTLLCVLLLASGSLAAQKFTITDSFDDNHNKWWEGDLNGGSAHIRDGKMRVTFPKDGWILAISPYVAPEKDFKLQMAVRQLNGETNGVGITWGYNRKAGKNNYFVVSANGYFYVSNGNADAVPTKGIREWQKSSAVKLMPETNVLTVEQKQGALYFTINGTQVFTTPAFKWPGREIGVTTSIAMDAEFDDFLFEQPGFSINLPPNLTKGLIKENMGPNINTAADDLSPRISADGKTLYFGREYYSGNIGGVDDGEDFYYSTFDGSSWSVAQNLGAPINSEKVDNIASFSTDNNSFIFIRSGRFMIQRRIETGWGEPEDIGLGYTNEASHFEATLAPDGKAILFTTQNPSNLFYGQGEERDIYVSNLQENGTWGSPINLGRTINTSGDETSPFLAADGRTLYYSTDGKPGYGGADVFMSRRIGNSWTQWTEPVNLGPEINTGGFDAYYVVPASGAYAYMVSDIGGFGKADLVQIKLPQEIKPDPVVLVHGRTLDAKTKNPISADIHIDNLALNKEVGEAISDPKTGSYKIVLPYGFSYGFHGAAPGYLSVNENLELLTVNSYTEMEKDLYLVPIEIGQAIQLNNVFFEQGKAILKPESFPELDRLVQIMKDNPTMEIALNGYTDNIGRPVSLIALSMDRVGTVKAYMVNHGIAARRITGKGYGPENPIVKNDTEEHRRMNRRVEFKVTKK